MVLEKQKPYLAMILVRFISAGNNLFAKAALSSGMSGLVFAFYRQIIATLFLAPFVIILGSKRAPPLSFTVIWKIFLISLIGNTSGAVFFVFALDYTSATLSAAFENSVPVVTFLIAILLRMEIVKLSSSVGKAKVVGVVFCTAGILTVALYKGQALKFLKQDHPIIHEIQNPLQIHDGSRRNWIKGSFLMFLSNAIWALWFILQARVLEWYPSNLLLTFYQCLFSTVQMAVIAVAFERNPSKWKLGLDVELLSVAYCGIFYIGITNWLQAWSIEKKGPVFTAIFNPLTLIITMALSGILLGELITLGSVLGGVLMVIGLYLVLWGKSKESLGSQPANEQEK